MNRWIIATTILATIVIGFTLLVIAGLFLEDNTTNVWEPETSNLKIESDIPGDTVDASPKSLYMQGCDPDGVQTTYCLCSWDALTSRWSTDQIATAGIEYSQTGQMPQAMIDAIVNDCL